METLLKETLSNFLKIDAASINPATVIDRSVVGNSILLHRMYARFSQQGIEVPNYNSIRTFGDLVSRVNGNGNLQTNTNSVVNENVASQKSDLPAQFSLGIDIENASSFESATDYREAAFYKSNFSAEEISYCLLQPNTLLSFAGLFAAKEAIVKADNSYQGVNFNNIEIKHDKLGKPVYKNFSISISHTDGVAVAVAFLPPQTDHNIPKEQSYNASISAIDQSSSPKHTNFQLAFLLISIVALILATYAVVKLSLQ